MSGRYAISTLLPTDIREALIAAAAIDPNIKAGESVKRANAIDSIHMYARHKHPHLFKVEGQPVKVKETAKQVKIIEKLINAPVRVNTGLTRLKAKFPYLFNDEELN